uniref:Uncharacterized protein n=1 Tax=Arundo donax TaxID=35708 RepID=A0A0A8ZCA2_ARUDO
MSASNRFTSNNVVCCRLPQQRRFHSLQPAWPRPSTTAPPGC